MNEWKTNLNVKLAAGSRPPGEQEGGVQVLVAVLEKKKKEFQIFELLKTKFITVTLKPHLKHEQL